MASLRMGLLIVWPWVAACLSACSPGEPGRLKPETVIQPHPDPVVMGTVTRADPVYRTLRLQNLSDRPITVQVVEVSCECVSMAPVPLTIESSRVGELIVEFDPREDPGFRGKLGVMATGRDREGRALFQTRVDVEVANEMP